MDFSAKRRFLPLYLELLNVFLERTQSPSDRDPFTADEDDFAQSPEPSSAS